MRPIINTLEIHFWNWYIPLMSESSTTGEFARRLYILTHNRTLMILAFQIIATVTLGYLLGLGIGFAKASLP